MAVTPVEGDQAEAGVACLLCGSTDQWQPVLRDVVDHKYKIDGTWDFRRCRACRLVALHPLPADIAAGYPAGYSQHRAEQPSAPSTARTPLRRWLRRRVLAGRGYAQGPGTDTRRPTPLDRVVASVPAFRVGALWGCLLVPPSASSRRLLDVGCGNGRFLAHMAALGWDVQGVEPDPRSRAAAEAKGLRVVASVEDGAFEPASFDVITLNHVIEHLSDPEAELRTLRLLCADGGLLGIATPNWASATRRLFGRSWYALEPPRHVVLFDPNTLRQAVEGAGFEVRTAATRSVREGPPAWRLSWAFRQGRQPPRAIVALGTAVSCAAAWFGAGEEIELWATAVRANVGPNR